MAKKDEAIETTAVVVRESEQVVRAEDFMPLMTVQQAVERKNQINQFIGQVLKENEDYGVIPGSRKNVLLKPGAEKLCSIFGMAPSYLKEQIIESWTGQEYNGEPLFSYEYRCQLYRGGRFMGEAIGSCNSWESKYRYRWLSESQVQGRPDKEQLPKRGGKKTIFEPNFAIDKAETEGKYGKPAEYWARFRAAAEAGEAKVGKKKLGEKEFVGYFLTMDETQYRIPNPEIADVINTCQKMAQKRALVAAVLVVTNCSDAFTQDMEDFAPPETHTEAPTEPIVASHSKVAEENVEKPINVTLPSERPVPEELKQILHRIQHDPPHFMDACQIMEAQLTERGGDNGRLAYSNICDAFSAKFKKLKRNPKTGELMDTIMDLFEALQTFPPKQAA